MKWIMRKLRYNVHVQFIKIMQKSMAAFCTKFQWCTVQNLFCRVKLYGGKSYIEVLYRLQIYFTVSILFHSFCTCGSIKQNYLIHYNFITGIQDSSNREGEKMFSLVFQILQLQPKLFNYVQNLFFFHAEIYIQVKFGILRNILYHFNSNILWLCVQTLGDCQPKDLVEVQ